MSNETPMQLDILYEDDACVVLDKPAGLMVHPDGRSTGPFLTDWIAARYPEALNVGEPMNTANGESVVRPGIVHRLDRDTSGAIVVAKTAEAYSLLKKQFQDRGVSKKYLTFVWGEIKEEFGTINRPIGRSANEFPKWSAMRGKRGELRDAETYWTRMWTGTAEVAGTNNPSGVEKFSLILAEPKTGRTHQIRVHFQAINHPVVCDVLYADNKPKALGFERMALHALSIEFENIAGKRVKVVSPLPADFVRAMKDNNIKEIKG